LYFNNGSELWGIYNPEQHSVDIHDVKQPGDQVLINIAAINTFMKNGNVYLMTPEEMPEARAALNAVYRY
jgi:hypothetical protein